MMTPLRSLRVWWIPQIPMVPFYVGVKTVSEGVLILRTLAQYDAFQLRHHVRWDYCNTGGLQVWVEDAGDGQPDWVDWYDEESGEDDPEVWVASCLGRLTTGGV